MPQYLSDVREPVNALYYGDSGTGKTTALASMANLGKVLVVNAEGGLKSRPLRQMGIQVENIEVFPGVGEQITFDSLQEQWLRVREELEKDPVAYAGVIWDSVTEIHKALLDRIVTQGVEKANRQGMERDPFFIDIKDYGTMTEQVKNLVRKYRDLPCHFGMTALNKRIQDNDGAVSYQPSITPALRDDLVGWVDVVCVTSVALVDNEDEYRGLFRPHNKFRGKDRLGVLPKWLPDPSFERVVAYAEGELTQETDELLEAARERAARAHAAERDQTAAVAIPA